MTQDDFQKEYAKITGLSWGQLQSYLQVIPCTCGKGNCPGWQMITLPTPLPPLQVHISADFPMPVRSPRESVRGRRDFIGA